MIEIPKNTATLEDLQEWYKLKKELAKIKQSEALLRSRIFHTFFPEPEEGTNNYDINDGTGAVLKATYTINRKVIREELDGLADALAQPENNLPKINLNRLIEWKPEVSIKNYRTLTDEERNLFDNCLEIKPGSPQMEIVIPKRPKRK